MEKKKAYRMVVTNWGPREPRFFCHFDNKIIPLKSLTRTTGSSLDFPRTAKKEKRIEHPLNIHEFVLALLLLLFSVLQFHPPHPSHPPPPPTPRADCQVLADDACAQTYPRPQDSAPRPEDAEYLPHAVESSQTRGLRNCQGAVHVALASKGSSFKSPRLSLILTVYFLSWSKGGAFTAARVAGLYLVLLEKIPVTLPCPCAGMWLPCHSRPHLKSNVT